MTTQVFLEHTWCYLIINKYFYRIRFTIPYYVLNIYKKIDFVNVSKKLFRYERKIQQSLQKQDIEYVAG